MRNIYLITYALFLFQILYRTEIDGNSDPYYQIEFEERMSDTLAKRKCKHVKAYNGEQNRRTYCLCKECNAYLDGDRISKVESEFGWCSYIW